MKSPILMNGSGGIGLDVFVFDKQNLRAGLIVSLLSVWVLVGVFYYLNRYTRRRYFSIWTVAWLFYALWLTLNLGYLSETAKSVSGAASTPVLMLRQWCISVSATFLLWGSMNFLGKRVRQILLSLFLAFLFIWSFVGARILEPRSFAGARIFDQRLLIELPIFSLIGLASLFTATGFYRYRLKRDYIAASLLALGFSLWGGYLILYSFLEKSEDLSSAGFFLSAVLQLFIAVSMIILVLEQVRFAQARKAQWELRRQALEKRALQTKVISTEERYRQLFQQASEAIILAAAEDFRIVELNEAGQRLLGLSSNDLGRHSFISFCKTGAVGRVQPRSSAEWFDWICKQSPLQIARKDGTVVPTEFEGAPIEYQGVRAYQLFAREITDRADLEKQLHRAEKLSSLGQMISGVAHELQNPVAGIKAFLDLALATPNLEAQVKSDLDRAAQECGRVSRLARNFLSLAREQSSDRQWCDANELIRNLVELRKFEFSVGKIEVILDLDERLPKIFIVPEQIQQVLVNLLNNALQALHDCGRPAKIRIRTRTSATHVEIAVFDNGPGVPESLEEKIFAPFFTTKPVGIGTGLGLSISHSILCDHGGRIFYQRSEWGGAGFICELPISPDASPPAVCAPAIVAAAPA